MDIGKHASWAMILLSGLAAGCATPLTKAAAHGDVDQIKALLDAGADINRRDTNAIQTPLQHALWNHQPNAAKLLVERGARLS